MIEADDLSRQPKNQPQVKSCGWFFHLKYIVINGQEMAQAAEQDEDMEKSV